jgi:hypothetical protein
MAIEESHPLALVPDLVDQLTERERRFALQRWENLYLDANRLVHPNTRRRSPASIACSAILEGVNARYSAPFALCPFLVVIFAGYAISTEGRTAAILTAADVVVVLVGSAIATRWLRRRRFVRAYFVENFPDGPTKLPARR